MMKKSVGILVTIMVAVTAGAASADSVFNLNLIGERLDGGDVRAIALGGGMQVIDDSLAILQDNPAAIAGTGALTFAISQFFGGGQNQSENWREKSGIYKLTSFGLAFPIMPQVAVGVGYQGGYDPSASFMTALESSDGKPYSEIYTQRGGLSRYPLTIATTVIDRRIKLGASYAYESGTIEKRWDVDFPPGSADAFSSIKRTFRGSSFGGGIVVDAGMGLTIGAAYRSEVSYDTRVDERYSNDNSNAQYSETTTLPQRWTGSMRVNLGPDWRVYAGGLFSDFRDFSGVSFPAHRLVSEKVATVGAEHLRALFSLPVRAAVTYEQLPYTLPAGENVTRWSLSLGTGLKLSGDKGKLDVTMQLGRVGTVETNGFQDRYFRMYVGVSGAELWKRERETDY